MSTPLSQNVLPAGSWPSAISAHLVASAAPQLDYPMSEQDVLYWLENRPTENGRGVVVQQWPDGSRRDLLAAPLSVRTRIHEYGGRPYCVRDGVLYFCRDDDQRIWRLAIDEAGAEPQPLTPDNDDRYGELLVDSRRQRLIAVREQTRADQHPLASLVAIPLDGSQELTELIGGSDFYAFPRLSPDGRQLAWISWDHPQMPWDHTELWCAALNDDGLVTEPRRLAGHMRESIFQPEWLNERQLIFVTDRSNWWNLYCCDSDGRNTVPLLPMSGEFATPLWTLGMSTVAVSGDGAVYAAFSQDGQWQLGRLANPARPDATWSVVPADCTHWHGLAPTAHGFLAVGAAPDRSPTLYQWRDEHLSVVADPGPLPVDPAWLSKPISKYFPTSDDSDYHIHGLYYPPTNPGYTLAEDELPPLIVIGHGGPTGATSTALNYKIQFWTSRGFAVLDVNYRGSTGFGRRYREALYERWGIADVEDICSGARFMVKRGLAHPNKLIVRGSSAGGYSVLCALAFHDVFDAGASLYGIGDLETLARDTHKFEAWYLDSLVGPYPETRARYQERSPVHYSEHIQCPVIFFQGLDDKVVPPSQAETMVSKLREEGTPVAYLAIPGEGHGFRQLDNVCRVLEAELVFYGQVFNFTPADVTLALTVDHL